jgi:hypothetical protein
MVHAQVPVEGVSQDVPVDPAAGIIAAKLLLRRS